jgi:hypothetical protein
MSGSTVGTGGSSAGSPGEHGKGKAKGHDKD